jgi:hypothetical protein
MERKGFSAGAGSWADRRKSMQPISISGAQLVRAGHLPGREEALPLVIEPNPEVGPLKLHEWAADNIDFIERSVLRYGGVLFRNWDARTQDDFHRVLGAIGAELIQYTESSTPRRNLKNNVYTSTEFPQDQTIALHNELSTAATFPLKIWFFCDVPAEQGGERPSPTCAACTAACRRRPAQSSRTGVAAGEELRRRLRPHLAGLLPHRGPRRGGALRRGAGHGVRVEGGRPPAHPAGAPRRGGAPGHGRQGLVQPHRLLARLQPGPGGPPAPARAVRPGGHAVPDLLRRRHPHRGRGRGRAARRLPGRARWSSPGARATC